MIEARELSRILRVYIIDAIPLTDSGKINHKKLYDLLPGAGEP